LIQQHCHGTHKWACCLSIAAIARKLLVAAGDVRLLYIDQRRFEGILRECPETSLAVMRELCTRIREREAAREPG
jgi:hypothetical protein